jgi:hypothetical protein
VSHEADESTLVSAALVIFSESYFAGTSLPTINILDRLYFLKKHQFIFMLYHTNSVF